MSCGGLLAVEARELLRRVGGERDAELAALLGVADHRVGIVGADQHEVDVRVVPTTSASEISRASLIAPG